ncbi:microprocessor complex subunit DGCR8-like [Vanessa atalanta]|uniref:microprocessor complex subunit DGCR8-like n=1 Tax=Vanessa atalanta TaxID=42275 RepID=UPI001FCD0AA5|nr:microprocessor complex subunit DGCR8-like [Vanessa atalanta]XP_047543758.1 microprocessor complex subunit DGCR8-like [Vanessa atalanta]
MSEGREKGSPPENKRNKENSNDNGVNDNANEDLKTSQEKMDVDCKIDNTADPVELEKEDGLKTKKGKPKKKSKKSKKSGQSSSAQAADEKDTECDFLPPDWKVIWHDIGVPIYMYKPTRVCTLSKPYIPEAGKGISKSTIPNVAQRRELENLVEMIKRGRLAQEQKQSVKSTETQKYQDLERDENQMDVSNPPVSPDTAAEKESSNEDKKMDIVDEEEEGRQDVAACIGYSDNKGFRPLSSSSSSSSIIPLSQESTAPASQQSESPNTNSEFIYHVRAQINKSCKNTIKLEPINHRQSNHVGRANRPPKPIFYPYRDPNLPSTSTGYRTRPRRHGYRAMPAIQPDVKTNEDHYLSIFHEYVCNILQKQPTFVYKQSANSSMIKATVLIGNDNYGEGFGYSKREAKLNAIRLSMQRLIPEVHRFILHPPISQRQIYSNANIGFDDLEITDPKVLNCDDATPETAPHDVLLVSIREMGDEESSIQIQTRRLKYNCIELTMQVNQHSATVLDNNRRSAKQRAAQAILKALHPALLSYGSLLRKYGIRFDTRSFTRRPRRRRIRGRSHNESHRYILSTLRDEMIIVRERDEIYARAAAGNCFFQSSPEYETD